MKTITKNLYKYYDNLSRIYHDKGKVYLDGVQVKIKAHKRKTEIRWGIYDKRNKKLVAWGFSGGTTLYKLRKTAVKQMLKIWTRIAPERYKVAKVYLMLKGDKKCT